MLKSIPDISGNYFCDMSGKIFNKHKRQLKPFSSYGTYYRINLNKKICGSSFSCFNIFR